MNIYFDTEFTGLHKNTTLISLGMITDDGDKFYAEFRDYDPAAKNDPWLVEHVFNNTIIGGNKNLETVVELDPLTTLVIGDTKDVVRELRKWLGQFDGVQLYSDVCEYDMVLFIDLFGDSAFDLPENISPVCHDINQDIAAAFSISDRDAFDLSREKILSDINVDVPGVKHNALYDAQVIRQVYYACLPKLNNRD